MQFQITGILSEMKIKPNELHFSQGVLEKFDTLREELLMLFAVEKHIEKKRGELDSLKEQMKEFEALKTVYTYHKKKEERDREAAQLRLH